MNRLLCSIFSAVIVPLLLAAAPAPAPTCANGQPQPASTDAFTNEFCKEQAKCEAASNLEGSGHCGWLARELSEGTHVHDVKAFVPWAMRQCDLDPSGGCETLFFHTADLLREGEAWAKPLLAKAFEKVSAACDAGHAGACGAITRSVQFTGTTPDLDKKLYEKDAALCADASALKDAADRIKKNACDAKQSRAKSIELEAGCAGKQRSACHELGRLLRAGKGAAFDPKRGDALVAQACKLGSCPACLEHGGAEAISTCEKTCNDPTSETAAPPQDQTWCSITFGLIQKDAGNKKGPARALKALTSDCVAGRDCLRLSSYYAVAAVSDADAKVAAQALDAACKKGSGEDIDQDLLCGFKQKRDEYQALVKRCTKGDLEACEDQGGLLQVEGEDAAATAPLKKACDGGKVHACEKLKAPAKP